MTAFWNLTIIFQQQMAQQVLTQFQEHPDSWTRVPDILDKSSFPESKVGYSVNRMRNRSNMVIVHWSSNSRKAYHH